MIYEYSRNANKSKVTVSCETVQSRTVQCTVHVGETERCDVTKVHNFKAHNFKAHIFN